MLFVARTIKLETPRYVVRSLEPADAARSWNDWLKDPQTLRNLNARATTLSEEDLQAYIARFDRKTSHVLGIFKKDTDRLIGVRTVYVDPARNDFVMNVLIGESDARNQGARTETRDVIYRFFFEELDLHAARCTAVSTNEGILRVLENNGWIHERTDKKASATGEGFVELLSFRLPREVWRNKEAEKSGQ